MSLSERCRIDPLAAGGVDRQSAQMREFADQRGVEVAAGTAGQADQLSIPAVRDQR